VANTARSEDESCVGRETASARKIQSIGSENANRRESEEAIGTDLNEEARKPGARMLRVTWLPIGFLEDYDFAIA
jgi:hypothetical protein